MGSIPVGQGYYHVRTLLAPSPGGNFTIAPIPGTRMRIVALRFRLATFPGGGNRVVGMRIQDAATVAGESSNNIFHVGAVVAYYSLWPGYSGEGFRGVSVIVLPWRGSLIVDQEYYLQSFIFNIQMFDQLSEIVYATEEWISEP